MPSSKIVMRSCNIKRQLKIASFTKISLNNGRIKVFCDWKLNSLFLHSIIFILTKVTVYWGVGAVSVEVKVSEEAGG